MNLEQRIRLGLGDLSGDATLPEGFADRVLPRLASQRGRSTGPRIDLARAAAAFAGLAALLILTVLLGAYLAAPLATTRPTASGTTSSQPSPAANTYPDGVPREIDGQAVLEGAAAVAHAVAATDSSPFFVGGRYSMDVSPCPAPVRPWFIRCGGTFLAPAGDSGPVTSRPRPTAVLFDASVGEPLGDYLGSKLVVRVHVHDPLAADCVPTFKSLCEQAFVLESLVWVGPVAEGDHRADIVDALAGRSDDGLPRSIGGRPVLRGEDAAAHAAATNDTTPFLIGGWLTHDPSVTYACSLAGSSRSWNFCTPFLFSDLAGSPEAVAIELTFRFSGFPATGPIVAQVHLHDPRAFECGDFAPRCDRMAVVDQVLWAGDPATDPRPLSVDRLDATLLNIDPNLGLHSVGGGGTACGASLRSGESFIVSGGPATEASTTFAVIWPRESARERALPVAPGPSATFEAGSVACTVIGQHGQSSTTLVYRWLAVENVALLIKTRVVPTAADRAFVSRLALALENESPASR